MTIPLDPRGPVNVDLRCLTVAAADQAAAHLRTTAWATAGVTGVRSAGPVVSAVIPARLAVPFAENALVHGWASEEEVLRVVAAMAAALPPPPRW